MGSLGSKCCYSSLSVVFFILCLTTSKLVSREPFGNEITFLLHMMYPAVVLIVAVKHRDFEYHGSLKRNFFSLNYNKHIILMISHFLCSDNYS